MKLFIVGVVALCSLIGTEGCTVTNVPVYKGTARPNTVALANGEDAEIMAVNAYLLESVTGQRVPRDTAEMAWRTATK